MQITQGFMEDFQGEAHSDVPTSVLWALHPQVNLVMTGSEAQPHLSARLPSGRHTCRANLVSGQRVRPISLILGSASWHVGS